MPYKKKSDKNEDEGTKAFSGSRGVKVSITHQKLYKKFATEVKRSLRVLFEYWIEKNIICAEKTPTGYYIPAYHLDVLETKERVRKPKKIKKKKEKVIERKASKKFKETWDILNWMVKDFKREKWVSISKKEAISLIKNLINLISMEPLPIESITTTHTLYEGNNTVFKRAFDGMIYEIAKASREKWKKETSREEAIRLFNITLDIISAKETVR